MKEKCEICNEQYDGEAFVKHLRKHKIKIEDYYLKYLPRFDHFSQEPIRFKTREQYLYSMFNTRTNMINFFKQNEKNQGNSPELNRWAAKEIVALRQSFRDFKYVPSTIEARTSLLPTPLLMEKYDFDYNKLWKSVSKTIIAKYDYSEILRFKNLKDLKIIIDTREQKPLSFDCSTIVQGLKYGDYATYPSCGLVIERKSLPDLCGTLSAGYERFQREIERAIAAKEMLLVCVETDVNTLQSFNYLPHFRHIKASPEFICHRMRELCQKYPEIQFLLVKNRALMAPTIKKILTLKSNPAQIDFQYHFDKNDFV